MLWGMVECKTFPSLMSMAKLCCPSAQDEVATGGAERGTQQWRPGKVGVHHPHLPLPHTDTYPSAMRCFLNFSLGGAQVLTNTRVCYTAIWLTRVAIDRHFISPLAFCTHSVALLVIPFRVSWAGSHAEPLSPCRCLGNPWRTLSPCAEAFPYIT